MADQQNDLTISVRTSHEGTPESGVTFDYRSQAEHSDMCGPLQVAFDGLVREYARVHDCTKEEALPVITQGLLLIWLLDDDDDEDGSEVFDILTSMS